MIQQKLAADELTLGEIGLLEDLAEAWGLIDAPTARLLEQTGKLISAFEDKRLSEEELIGAFTEMKDRMVDEATPAIGDMETAASDLDAEMKEGLIDDSLPAAKQQFEEMMGAATDASTEIMDGLVEGTLPETEEALEDVTTAAEDTTEAIEEIPEEWETRVDIVGHLQVIAAAENVKEALEGIPRFIQVRVRADVDPLLIGMSPSPLEISIRGITDAIIALDEAAEGLSDFSRAFAGLGGIALDFFEEGTLDPLENMVDQLTDQLEESGDALREIDENRTDLMAEADELMAAQVESLRQYEQIQADIVANEEALRRLAEEKAELRDEQASLGDQMARQRTIEENALEELARLEEERERMRERGLDDTEEYQDIVAQIADQEQIRNQAVDEMRRVQELVNRNQDELNDIISEEQRIRDEITQQEIALLDLQDARNQAAQRLLDIDREIAGLDRQRREELAEYQRIQATLIANQEELNRLKQIQLEYEQAQQELKYLEQQRELLDLIGQYGLDMGSILQGLQLGPEADPAAVLQAMTRALEAIALLQRERLAEDYPGNVPPWPGWPPPAPGAPPGWYGDLEPRGDLAPGAAPEYHLHIHSNAPVEIIADDFYMMQALA
jgi:hypothetical protein